MSSQSQDAFFASLPGNELLPIEHELRRVLIDFIMYHPMRQFPLCEWIDRRIGGEVATHKGMNGQVELRMRSEDQGKGAYPGKGWGGCAGGGPPLPPPGHGAYGPPGSFTMPPHVMPGAWPGGKGPPPETPRGAGGGTRHDPIEAILSKLPEDDFDPKEHTLREAVFEFLAGWKKKSLASLQDMEKHPPVTKAKRTLLGDGCPLKSWIERRIGGEVEIDNAGIVQLTKEGQRLVREKYEQMKGGAKGGSASDNAPATSKDKEDFFNSLPEDELKPEELALRSEVLDFLKNYSRQKKGSAPTVTHLSGDAKIAKACKACLPAKIKLRSWIERRIGGELEIRKDPASSDSIVMFRGSAPPPPPAAPAGPKGKSKGKPVNAKAAEDFINSLPQDDFTEAEQNLRAAVFELLEKKKGRVTIAELDIEFEQDPILAECKTECLPPEVPLDKWIDMRIGGEVEIITDRSGQQILRKRGEGDDEPHGAADPVDSVEDFFAGLPGDSFSKDEESLRESLLTFVRRWRQPKPPTIQQVKRDAEVSKHCKSMFPPGCPVELSVWIDRRIGGELQVAGGPSELQLTISLVEQPPPQQGAAKRQRR